MRVQCLFLVLLGSYSVSTAADVVVEGNSAESVVMEVSNTGLQNRAAIKGNSGGGGVGVLGRVESATTHQWMLGVQGQAVNTKSGSSYSDIHGVGVWGKSVGNNNNDLWSGDNTYGVYAEAIKANKNYGVYAVADAMGGRYATGVYGEALGGTVLNRAALFNGDVVVTGACACSPSDQKLKTNIHSFEKGLDVVLALRPTSYDMRVEEYKGRLTLAAGPQVGLLAQDVEKLVPEAVVPVHIPARETKAQDGTVKTVAEIDYKSLNYDALIPVLINAIQEQQAQIMQLKAQIEKR